MKLKVGDTVGVKVEKLLIEDETKDIIAFARGNSNTHIITKIDKCNYFLDYDGMYCFEESDLKLLCNIVKGQIVKAGDSRENLNYWNEYVFDSYRPDIKCPYVVLHKGWLESYADAEPVIYKPYTSVNHTWLGVEVQRKADKKILSIYGILKNNCLMLDDHSEIDLETFVKEYVWCDDGSACGILNINK